ncbi:MAG: glycine cleavage system aminomethyltransferase GcvT, partial [Spirochaetes bacterium]|nr:glycine cleavage system aminomethyltransferase GcvT [Spirochaetota bacterium]
MILEKICDINLSDLKYYRITSGKISGKEVPVSRTGYTGEDGFEFYVAADFASQLWDMILKLGVKPCGLGARDTLRLEAAMPLYGHEYNEETSPLEAGFDWIVKLDKGDFIGREALL